jgi:endonuclease YncB( thermonuclease family)
MKRFPWTVAGILAAALVAIAIFLPPHWSSTHAFVTYVYDGDTLTVRYLSLSTKLPTDIRLYSIDAPELPLGEGYDSRDYLRSMCNGKYVTIKYWGAGTLTYGRLLAYVSIADPDGGETDLSCAMLHQGYAKVKMLHPEEQKKSRSIYSCCGE